MTTFPSTNEDFQKINAYISHGLLPMVFEHMRTDEYAKKASHALARIDAGEQFTVEQLADELRLPEFVLLLMAEIRQSDLRIANYQQNQEREALGSTEAFLEKIRSTKH